MRLVERIRTIEGMPGLSQKTKDIAIKDLLSPFVDDKAKAIRGEVYARFTNEFRRAPKYLRGVLERVYGMVPAEETADIELPDIDGLSGDSPDISRFYEDIPPRP